MMKIEAKQRLQANESLDRNAVIQIVMTIAKQHGWKDAGNGQATKSFSHAAGGTSASMHVSKGDGYNISLVGNYQSEGRNALESNSVLIPSSADATQVQQAATKFFTNVEKAIESTYGMSRR